MAPSWAVVATVDEPAALVAAFAAHHLAIGAAEVHLFLDRPDLQVSAALAGLAGCYVTVCDDAYWQASRRKTRPLIHTTRQSFNANVALGRTRADWLLHCDCDEFVRDGAAVAAELAKAPPQAVYLRLLMAERVRLAGETGDIFTGVFRHALPEFSSIGPMVYGLMADFFKEGLTGHKAGKALVRVGAGAEMSIHAPKGRPVHRVIQSTRLLHFDGLTRLHYMIKLLRRAHEPVTKASARHGKPRTAQFQALREAMADPALRAHFLNELTQLQPDQANQLHALCALDLTPFDRAAALSLLRGVDLSEAGFDAALRLRYADFLAEYAPDLA